QPFANPGFALQPIVEAVMQAARPALPELDAVRQQPIAAPMWRAVRSLIEEALFGLHHQVFQLGAVPDHPALRRGPGTDAAAQRADLEVTVGFGSCDALHAPFNAHLALQAGPEEGHGGKRTGRQLTALGAV